MGGARPSCRPGGSRISRENMSYENTPHVCFRVTPPTSGDVTDTVPRLIERQLRQQFESVQLLNSRFLPPMTAVLSAEGRSFAMVLGKSKYEAGEWILIVGPSDSPSQWARLRRQRPVSNVAELRRVCDTIHELLIALPGVSALRWYFEGARNPTTPRELPWG